MRAVIQRVSRASVTVEGEEIAQIGWGLLVLLGVAQGDVPEDARYVAEKAANLRIFEDDEGKMNLSVKDIGGEILLVSQFTLMGDARKGRRPSFAAAGNPQNAQSLYEKTAAFLKETGITVKMGKFQAHMDVSLVNDGPVTILLDSGRAF